MKYRILIRGRISTAKERVKSHAYATPSGSAPAVRMSSNVVVKMEPRIAIAIQAGKARKQRAGHATSQLAPLDRSSLRDQASQSIRASISAGEFEAGRIYPVAFFANKLGFSATPIREALFDLVGASLIEAVRNRGFRVPIRSERELDELFDLRMLLERPAVVRLAANPKN